MFRRTEIVSFLLTAVLSMAPALPLLAPVSAAAQTAAPSGIAKQIGKIKAINGNQLTIAPESGADVPANVDPNARILRMNPGDKDLKNATPIQLQDLQVGDTVRVRGHMAADGKTINALEVLVISRSTIDAVREQIREDWQKRGVGGLVSSVDPAARTVTISVTSFAGKKQIVIHATKTTAIRRYAPDSVKFDDAKLSTLQEIHPGDQLRARGEHNADSSEVTAEEIVTGSFRNIAGTVISAHASNNTVTVQDLLTKKPVLVKITADSQLHKLPEQFAQRIAMRLKASIPTGTPGARPSTGTAEHSQARGAPEGQRESAMANGGAGSAGGGMHRSTDFQQMLKMMPAVTLTDLHKGDAVLIVATEGNAASSTAITLLSGVEPILQAVPKASDMMMLTPWSLGGGTPGGDSSE